MRDPSERDDDACMLSTTVNVSEDTVDTTVSGSSAMQLCAIAALVYGQFDSRALTLAEPCSPYDAEDTGTAQCQEWCKYPDACKFCKCRACSMCKACTSDVPNDASYESCEEWCSVPEHCSSCKCKACPVCRACTPHDASDTSYEDSQPWCQDRAHCAGIRPQTHRSHRPWLSDAAMLRPTALTPLLQVRRRLLQVSPESEVPW